MGRKTDITIERIFPEQDDKEALSELADYLVDLVRKAKAKESKIKEEECRTYTVPEAAKIIGICNKTAYQMVTAGRLPVIRISDRKVVIPKRALDQWLEDAVQWPESVKN